MLDDFFGHAADQPATQTGHAMGCHGDQAACVSAIAFDDHVRRFADLHVTGGASGRRKILFAYFLQIPFASLRRPKRRPSVPYP
jgi:hypothetical protein